MKIQKKVLIIEIIGLVLCVLLSILIGHLMVDWVVEDGKLKKIVNENLIFAFVLVAYYIGLCVYHAKRTKEWYKLNQNDPDVSNSKKDTN